MKKNNINSEKNLIPFALIDSINNIDINQINFSDFPEFSVNDFQVVISFLSVYNGNNATFESYRRELERLLQWSWLIAKKSILELSREDIEAYIKFCMKPPREWIGKKNVARYIEKDGIRKPNPAWRPFIVKVSKSDFKNGEQPKLSSYAMSQSSIRALFAVLGSFFDYCLLEEKIQRNPISLIRQKSRYLQKQQKQQKIIRLSDEQWMTCLKIAKEMAKKNDVYKRTLFIITAMYLMYLRISEFVATERWTPAMHHFYRDSDEQWWFKVLGKGNKLRTIAVSDDMLKALSDYRKSLDLSALPSPSDKSPLIPKQKGSGAVESTRQIRRLIQSCFDDAVIELRKNNFDDEANTLETATAHWLRHTGISDDVNKRGRPIMHVRDDAGHASIVTTEGYSDVEMKDRYKSAKHKTIDVKKEKNKLSGEKIEHPETEPATENNNPNKKIIKWGCEYLLSHGYILKNNIPEDVQNTPWSYVVRFFTSDGYIYLKRTPKLLALEPTITKILHDQFHAAVPDIIAQNNELNCFLMKDAGTLLREILKKKFDTKLFCKAIEQFTATQIAVSDHINIFLDIGVPDWRLDTLPDLYRQLLLKKDILIEDGLSEIEIKKCEALLPTVSALCKKLSSYAIKPSIVQPDFNDNNTLIADDSQKITMIDLGEIVISHPFFSLINCLHQAKKHHAFSDEDDDYQKLMDACLKNYLALESKKNLLDAFAIAKIVWFVYGALANERLMIACGKEKFTPSFQRHGRVSVPLRELVSACAVIDDTL